MIMDYFTIGRGVMILWPFLSERFESPGKNLLRTSLVGRLDKRAAHMDTGHGNGVHRPDMFPDARSDEGQTGLSGYPNFSG